MAALSALGWLLPFPLTDLVLSAAARYWDGCEIGINAAANSFTLLYLVGPVLLLGLYAVGGLGYVVGPRVLGRDEAWSALLAAAATLSSLGCLGGQPGERLEPGRRPEALGRPMAATSSGAPTSAMPGRLRASWSGSTLR
jgi:hypothetical protein